MHAALRFALLVLASASTVAAQSPRPTREIAFPVTTGTWMSLDVTPDGRTIVFELAGDLFALPITGGDATALTRGPAFDAMPRVSPDGRTLAFISDRDGGDNIWLAALDGSAPRPLSRARRKVMLSPTFTPDGRSVLVTVTTPGLMRVAELWRYDVATGEGTRVLENRAGNPSPLNASPAPGAYGAAVFAGSTRAITAMVSPRAYGVRAGAASRLMTVDLATGRTEPLFVEGTSPSAPLLSPDGAWLAYGAQAGGVAGLRVRELATGRERVLAPVIEKDELESRATRDVLPRAAWTPDGRAIIIARDGQLHRIALADGDDAVIPFRAEVRATHPVAPRSAGRVDTGAVTARILTQLALANDGRVAVSAFARIYVTDARAQTVRRLTTDSLAREYFPTWSHDGTRVAFASWTTAGGALVVAQADGRSALLRVTTDGAFYADPAFSPDGQWLAAVRASEGTTRRRDGAWPGDAELIAISLRTRAVTRLGAAGALRRLRWSADGSEVYAFAQSTGLVAVRVADGQRRLVAPYRDPLRGPGFAAPEQGVPLADARAVLAQEGDSLLHVALSTTNGAGDSTRFDPRGARLLSSDQPEAIATSPDGRRVAWSTGRWVHRLTVGSSARTDEDSASLRVATPRARGRGTLILRGVTAVTMRGNEIVRDADIVVRDDRIVSVGPRGDVPAGARVLDLRGHTVLPGFVDTHAHWYLSPTILEPDGTAPWANLAHGITTARDPSAMVEIFAYADMAAAGVMPSPRLFSTGSALFDGWNVSSAAEAQRVIDRYRDRWETPYLKMYLAGDRQQRRWIADAAAARGMLATTEGGSDLRQDITHIFDGYSGNEHSLPATPLRDDLVGLMAQSRIAFTPTLLVAFGGPLPIYGEYAAQQPLRDAAARRWNAPEELYRRSATRMLWFFPEDYRVESQARDAAAIHRAGGLVAVGGHGELQGSSFHWELELLAQGGLSPHEVLTMATRNGAEALGLLDDLGTIEPGKLADLVIVSGDPLRDLRRARDVRYVVRNGELFDATTLAREWPTSAAAPLPWWRRGDSLTVHAFDPLAVDSTVTRLMTTMRAPGVAVAVVKDGVPVLAKGYGVANLETNTPVTRATMFQSGSLGKQFTAAGVLALVEEGKLGLDTSIRRYLPEAPPSWEPITIRHLLTHTGGMPDYTGDALDYRRDYTDAELLTLAIGLPVEFPAGSRWNYSNTGYTVLGIIIGRVSGMPYWTYLRERIFTPAGMRTIQVQTDSAIVPQRAQGYEPAGAGWRVQRFVSPSLNRTADGSMLLSLDDMLAWNAVVRRRAVLRPESWAAMLSPVRLTSGAHYPYGFAWFADSAAGAPLWQHGGAWQGFRTQYSRYTRGAIDVIVLANARTVDPDAIAKAVAATVESVLAEPALSVAITARDTSAASSIRRFLVRAEGGALDATDFSFARATIVGRMAAAAVAQVKGAGPLLSLELLARRVMGDDRLVTYRATYRTKRLLVVAQLTPDGRPTFARLSPLDATP